MTRTLEVFKCIFTDCPKAGVASEMFNLRLAEGQDVRDRIICGSHRRMLIAYAKHNGERVSIFWLPRTLEVLDCTKREREERHRREVAANLERTIAVLNGNEARRTNAPDRKRDKRLRDSETRARMKGLHTEIPDTHGTSRKSAHKRRRREHSRH